MLIESIIVFVVLLLVLVLVHELGHFLTAKLFGCRVEEFAFGFPPKILSKTKGETKYSFNLIPLGGYVKIEGEDMEEEDPGPRSFASKPAWMRIIILSAGVAMNVVLTIVLLSIQSGLGTPMLITEDNASKAQDIRAYVVEVDEGSPAEEAGIKQFDRIVAVETEENPDISLIQQIGRDYGGQEIKIVIDRQGIDETVTVVPRVNPPSGEGPIGMALQEIGLVKTPWYKAPVAGISRTYEMFVVIMGRFWQLIREILAGSRVGDILTGPIGIAIYTGEATSMGISYILEFAALISINLAIINFIPFPALDGGRVIFILFEILYGKRLSNKFEHWAHLTGFVLLMALMVYVTLNDIGRFL